LPYENSYYNETLDFYIEKPSDWDFIPTQWALNIRNNIAFTNDEIAALTEQANMPFVYMRKRMIETDVAHPTVQATCRYLGVDFPIGDALNRFSEFTIQTLEKSFKNFRLLEHEIDTLFFGHPGTFLKANFTINNAEGEAFECQSRSWSVFFNGLCYTIGASGSVENKEDYELEIISIENSVLIGKSTL